MSDETPKLDRRSFGFMRAGDLPGDWGTFTKDADQARQAFETAHSAQIPDQTPHALPQSRGQDTSHLNPARPRTLLDDPHPIFAAPSRRREEDIWRQILETKRDVQVLCREEFQKLRTQPAPKRRRRVER